MVEDVEVWADSRRWMFVWCCREKNKAAHWLASSCLSRKIFILTGLYSAQIRCNLELLRLTYPKEKTKCEASDASLGSIERLKREDREEREKDKYN